MHKHNVDIDFTLGYQSRLGEEHTAIRKINMTSKTYDFAIRDKFVRLLYFVFVNSLSVMADSRSLCQVPRCAIVLRVHGHVEDMLTAFTLLKWTTLMHII